jgi:hypothetical protein
MPDRAVNSEDMDMDMVVLMTTPPGQHFLAAIMREVANGHDNRF